MSITSTGTSGKLYRSKRAVASRYNRTVRTIDRWIHLGILPPPDININGHDMWLDATLDDADEARRPEAA
jgi:hypothetical protein